jgi:hypothetical protein
MAAANPPVHVMIIELLASGIVGGFKLEAAAFNPLLSIPLTSALVLSLSFAVVMVMKRIPLVRQIVP